MTDNAYHPFKKSLVLSLRDLEKVGVVRNILDKGDSVSLEYVIPLPQYPVYDIREIEPVTFSCKKGELLPLPYFDREDFPNVPHLLLNTGEQKSPCLIDTHFEQIALQWDADFYVRRLYEWLEKTAEGKLHQKDQPLENFLVAQGSHLILPIEYYLKRECKYIRVDKHHDNEIYYLESTSSQDNTESCVFAVNLGVKNHTGVLATPSNLAELGAFFSHFETDFDLCDEVVKLCKVNAHDDRSLLLFASVEINDGQLGKSEDRTYAFICHHSVKQIGEVIGVLGEEEGYYGFSFSKPDKSRLREVSVNPCSVHQQFNSFLGRSANGISISESKKLPTITQIGVGAIGSQIARNLSQAGFAARWQCIDNDILFPHNLSRWVLSDRIGIPKVNVLSENLNRLLRTGVGTDQKGNLIDYSVAFLGKVGFGRVDDVTLDVLNKCDVIIDSSASLSVQRTLDIIVKGERERFTIFLSPSGLGLGVFYSPKDWRGNHTILEMCFYKALINKPILNGFLDNGGGMLSYAGDSCRALSAFISTHQVSLLSSVASGIVEKVHGKEEALVSVFTSSSEFTIDKTVVEVDEYFTYQGSGEVVIKMSSSLITKLQSIRKEALPNETGGVLIGSFDVIQNTLYVVEQLNAPIDSEKTPTSFHRGVSGVGERLDEINQITHNNIYYIGEWHSHPEGVPPWPSNLDEKLLGWLRSERGNQIYPYLMLIVSEGDFTILY